MNDPGLMEQIGPGVLGYTVEQDDVIFIPAIYAENPGSGDVGRFLDDLPPGKTIKVPAVLSPKLAGMLHRRGFTETTEYAPEWEEDVPVFVRPPRS